MRQEQSKVQSRPLAGTGANIQKKAWYREEQRRPEGRPTTMTGLYLSTFYFLLSTVFPAIHISGLSAVRVTAFSASLSRIMSATGGEYL